MFFKFITLYYWISILEKSSSPNLFSPSCALKLFEAYKKIHFHRWENKRFENVYKKEQDNDARCVPMIVDSRINHADGKTMGLAKRQSTVSELFW